MSSDVKPSVARWSQELVDLHADNSFVVFLCGPTLNEAETKLSSALRKRLKEELEKDGFEVVLGEDDGLEDLRKQFNGMAHENELQFVKQESGAVVLIADSIGSFCELGLFAYTHYTDNEDKTDFILVLDEHFEKDVSYLNEGPKLAVETMGGKVLFGDFSAFDTGPIVDRLKTRRTVWFTHGKGRPKAK